MPECEHPNKLKYTGDIPNPTSVLWYGSNENKGLGVFSFGNHKLQLLDIHNVHIRLILPIAVTGGALDFTLFAVWAYNPQDPNYKYIGQIWKAILEYEDILKTQSVILAGDFNSNVIWDKLKRKVSHSMVVQRLSTLHISSAYHTHLNLKQGAEVHPTYYMYRHINRPYHIDYCFASNNLIRKLGHVEVGGHEEWTKHSDHNPLIISFGI